MMKNFSLKDLGLGTGSTHSSTPSKKSKKLSKQSSTESENITDFMERTRRSNRRKETRESDQERPSSTGDLARLSRGRKSSNGLNKLKTPKHVRKSLADLKLKDAGKEDSNVTEFIDSMKKKEGMKKTWSFGDKAAMGLSKEDLAKHAERLLTEKQQKKPQIRDKFSKDHKYLEQDDVDNIYKMVLQMKESEKGAELLEDFVHKQAGCQPRNRHHQPAVPAEIKMR
ncbi:expressed unknown protein [Seminavis robusta]|uniref:Uncharacterized protein n=1 Tax=Seminavis robusta TaxID=568900 RepID=A0A9N8EHZ2_9STRA|nr:expressed unknown protein [Seminavis robusta]|eukprot:Sro1109_g242230.1 n/a (226) ;mRNA; r:4132-4809